MDSDREMKTTVSSDGSVGRVPSSAEAVQSTARWLNVNRV